jgi:hypothetical protein
MNSKRELHSARRLSSKVPSELETAQRIYTLKTRSGLRLEGKRLPFRADYKPF